MADDQTPVQPKRDRHLNVRVDDNLYKAALDKAKPYGGLSVVVRAMLRAFTSGERNFAIDDIARENTPAPKPKSHKKKKAPKKEKN